MQRGLLIIICTAILLIAGCKKIQRSTEPSFYYWKTVFELSSHEKEYISALKVNSLYIRYFDVDWNKKINQPIPVGEITFKTQPPENLEIIPVVYLTNATFIYLPENQVGVLAEKVLKEINYIQEYYKIKPYKEIQMDCDWTIQTKPKFFIFLQKLSGRLKQDGKILSVTIRLHQVKYPDKTGIPPADKAVLMFYNMGKPEDPKTANSILDLKVSENYTDFIHKYPIKLDVALPLYSRAVLFRFGRVINMFNDLDSTTFDTCSFITKTGTSRYLFKNSAYLSGYYFYKNDEIKIETTQFFELEKAALVLNNSMKRDEMRVIFFHLDDRIIKKFTHEKVDTVCNMLH
jgi:hypothetical protein